MHIQFNKFFNSKEFDSPDVLYSGVRMNNDFIHKLSIARVLADIPFIINSGYRTQSHNEKIGGAVYSSHLKGLACDIRVTNDYQRFVITKSLLEAGFTRIGIAPTFIHVDDDKLKKQNIIWCY